MQNFIVVAAIAILFTWVFWDDIFGTYKAPNDDEFMFISEEEDYKNLKKFITEANNPELLDASFQLIIIFQEEYKGLYAEQKASNLIGIYEKRQQEMLLLN